MGLRDAFSKVMRSDGGSKKPLPPMTIQQLETLLEKRTVEDRPVHLIIRGNGFTIMPRIEYERVMKVVEAIESMTQKIQETV
tara:strand:+ start:311 stop:556 length:246 start_codon:yes stop_codon:yes gene_type:complete